jgi:hypothetical protein
MKHKIIAAILFAAAAAATANWLEYAFFERKPYGYPIILWIALIGCVLFALGCAIVFFNFRYGIFAGLSAALLSWPYFGLLAWNLQWRDFLWLVRIHYHGADQVTAVLLLLAASVFLLSQLLPSLRSVSSMV